MAHADSSSNKRRTELVPTDSKGQPIEAEYFFALLTRKGSNTGKNAFIRLCKIGCEPRCLGVLLMYLGDESSVVMKSTPEERIQRYEEMAARGYGPPVTENMIEVEMQRGTTEYEIQLRPLDSLESALGNDFTPRDLEAVQRNCKKLAARLDALQSTRLILHALIDDEFQDDRPLQLPYLLRLYADQFIPAILDKRRRIGPKQRPDYTQRLTKVYQHIHENTKAWHDDLVADILNDLLDFSPDQLRTAESQRAWRRDHCLLYQKL